MGASAQVVNYSNVIPFSRKPNNKVAGKDSEVYAFRTKEEITTMISVFDRHIKEADNDNQRQIANRNKMLFIIGINIGVRASDLRRLKWSFFFDRQTDGSLKFKESYRFIPMKQRRQKKFVKINFNNAVMQVIYNYINEYPISSLDDYLFVSRKGNEPITVDYLRRVVKSAAAEAGIKQNVGSHSLRKTFGRFCFEEAEDKTKALVVLQNIFNHSSTAITMRYIGLVDDDMKNMFDSINLGLDDL